MPIFSLAVVWRGHQIELIIIYVRDAEPIHVHVYHHVRKAQGEETGALDGLVGWSARWASTATPRHASGSGAAVGMQQWSARRVVPCRRRASSSLPASLYSAARGLAGWWAAA